MSGRADPPACASSERTSHAAIDGKGRAEGGKDEGRERKEKAAVRRVARPPSEADMSTQDMDEARDGSGAPPHPWQPTLKVFTWIADRWGLDDARRARLLGLGDEATLQAAMAKDGPVDGEMKARIAEMMSIYTYLSWSIPRPDLADHWMGSANRAEIFDGRSPLETMLSGGLPAMIAVRRHAEGMLW